ncbi:family 43 glycosylhydrolase [Labilibaculum sp. K2S]|uniref:family 43 glycosylhydrolase n=1 Tax=Labilibaculum sp. K2S TaxID=3056386 RepID=UPI0025A45029|nr:family 43 glycosylhydrolase [Labilibaculum sp. K2S]MDM8159863.1 family 43 glycosylhydrolase [Labilibaculum sp. K2S]
MFSKSKKHMILISGLCFFVFSVLFGCSSDKAGNDTSAYLFAYFTGNAPGEEAIHFAVSEDGFHYRALNNNKPVLDNAKICETGGVRDPHILRGADGKTFYMVATDLYVPEMGWKNYAMVLMKSTDLINWTSSVVNIPKAFPDQFGDVWRVWAPQTIYDEEAGKYMVYFSMIQKDGPDIIYYAYANSDFTALEEAPKQLFYNPTNNACIDADIIKKDGKFYLFHKSESGDPGIKLAVSDKLTEGYEFVNTDRVDRETENVEGSGVFKLNNSNEWILMYDVYGLGRYQFTKSSDFEVFTVIDQDISMNFHPRHGTVMPITDKELKLLVSTYSNYDDLLVDAKSPMLKKNNVCFKSEDKTIYLPVKTGADLNHFDPEFKTFSGISYSPKGPQDFSKGSVKYTFKIDGKESQNFEVSVSEDHNPVLEGYKADPDILYAEKTGKYYIYPTSDGFNNWSGYQFSVFSSDNLVDWTDEGVIIDLKKDVSWANRNAWAPCIVEKKIDGQYKYFYYFTAAQKIGVAVADNPTGPFVDSGKALIDKKPKGITNGQEIDPDVFTDPKTGKSYLYWGNGYMAAAELNDDMVSINEKTTKLMNVDNTYREGSYVIYRNGTYYFMWSEDDTRSPNYKVRYATSDSPVGKLTIPENNIVIRQDKDQEIYATGHNSAIQIPGKDEWYLVYHRFTRPKGITMGGAGGFHREVCIDKLEFNADGSIKEVKPTLSGIDAVNMN